MLYDKLSTTTTSSYSQHNTATDELYDNLNKRVDEFVETMLGNKTRTRDRVRYIQPDRCSVPNPTKQI